MQHVYTMTSPNLGQLEDEIRVSAIVTALDNITMLGSDVTITFKAVISAGDKTILDGIVAAHVPAAAEDYVAPVSITEQPPFAKPDFRTKMDSTTAWESFDETVAGGSKILDFELLEEKYVTGGEIIFKDAKEGDYISAEVYDTNSTIPDIEYPPAAPLTYRQALCEAWPSVSKYVLKRWIKPTEAGGYGVMAIDTYPLNAKITAGLFLRVTYHVNASVAGTRKVAINYNLTKKL